MEWKLGLYRGYLSSNLFGDTMVPNKERVRKVFAPQLVGNKAREGKLEKIACERLSK